MRGYDAKVFEVIVQVNEVDSIMRPAMTTSVEIITDTYGEVLSGLVTFSRYQPKESTRFQLPGDYPWPDRIFHLDRCASVHRIPTNMGPELVVINIHNSAFDKGGFLKKSWEGA